MWGLLFCDICFKDFVECYEEYLKEVKFLDCGREGWLGDSGKRVLEFEN